MKSAQPDLMAPEVLIKSDLILRYLLAAFSILILLKSMGTSMTLLYSG